MKEIGSPFSGRSGIPSMPTPPSRLSTLVPTFFFFPAQGPDRQMLAIEKMGATAIYATPTQLRLAGRQTAGATAPAVRRIMVGGAPCDRTTAKYVERQFPNAEVFEFYGSSETSFISIAKLTGGIRGPGKLFPGVEVKIGTMPGTIYEEIENRRHLGPQSDDVQ